MPDMRAVICDLERNKNLPLRVGRIASIAQGGAATLASFRRRR
jgi:hypothetical protein